MMSGRPKVAVIIEGGLIRNVLASEGMKVAVVEWDDDSEEERVEIFKGSYGFLHSVEPEVGSSELDFIMERVAELRQTG